VSPLDAFSYFVWSLFRLHFLITPHKLQIYNKLITQVCRQAIPCCGWGERIWQTVLALNAFLVHFKHVLTNTYFYMSTKSRCGQVRETDRVVGRGLVGLLPKIVVELEYPLPTQIPYFRYSGLTISNKSIMFSMTHSNKLSLHHSDQHIIFPILYRFPYGRKGFLIVIPPGISTVIHPTWNGKRCKLYRRDDASRFLLNVRDIYKTIQFRCGSPNP
jgi:hypothetical protein